MKNLTDIANDARVIPGFTEPMAFYGARCTWWTTDVTRDAGHQLGSIPCCPYCKSVLMQMPLRDFLGYAKQDPSHYGPLGLKALELCYHENNDGSRCSEFPLNTDNKSEGEK